MSWMPIKMGA